MKKNDLIKWQNYNFDLVSLLYHLSNKPPIITHNHWLEDMIYKT
jgi:hypothetical protein